MAEAIAVGVAVEVANTIIKKFGSAAYKKILFVKDQDSRIERLREIKSYIATVLRRVDPFEESDDVQGPIIARLRRIHDDLVYIFDELATRAKQKEVMRSSKITAKVCSVLPSYTMAKKINAITTELESFASDYASFTSGIVTNSSGNQNRCTLFLETGPFPDTDVLIGRDTDKENIIKMLCNSSNDQMFPSIVAIVGVGGQGKTTLAQYVCKDETVKGSFGMPLWVSAAPDSTVREILEKIIASATGEKPCNYDKEQLQRSVLNAIVGKKCLLVLDNIWYQDSLNSDWLELRALLGEGGFEASGSKILITARSKRAAKIMGIPAPYMLGYLTGDDSWTLLRHFALVQEKEAGVEEIGKEIAKMCPKLPLVIKVVGLQLAQMDTTRQWENFMKKLASNSTLYMQDKIMQTLKLCYDQLHDANLKRCVVFCSLFPKGHEYCTNYMSHLWMALGFLEPEDGISLEDVGEECVLKLASLGFLEQEYSFKSFKMHDVMHDLTLLIGKSTHQLINSETKEIADGVRHVSLNIADSNWKVLLEFRGKRNLESITLVSGHGNRGSIQVPLRSGFDELISACQRLKALEVYGQEVKKVPSSISQMVHLRYLNLSQNPLQKLPNSITQLVNLVSLNVAYCPNLQELPKDINKLDKLKELKIKGFLFGTNSEEPCWPLSHMPKGIGKLSNLEELDCFVVVGEDKSISSDSKASGAAKLEELGCLNNLREQLWIIVEGESKHIVSEAKTAKLEKLTDLFALIVEFKNSTEEDEMFLEGLQPNGKNLRRMYIVNYGGKKLPSWMRDDTFHAHFPKLHHIKFFFNKKIQDSDYFPLEMEENAVWINMRIVDGHDGMLEWVPGYSRLKELSRFGTIDIKLKSVKGNGIKDLTLDSLKIKKHIAQPRLGLNPERSFLNIQSLELWKIPELEVIPDQFRGLSSLKKLTIYGCPKLKAIPDWIDSFTTLRELWVTGCPKLESLPHQIGNLPESFSIVITYCSQVLVDKCQKPAGEYWPLIQHLCHINITFSKDVHVRQGDRETWHEKCRNETTTALVSPPSNAAPTPLTSNTSPSHSNTTSLKPFLFFILAFIMLILACVVGLRLV